MGIKRIARNFLNRILKAYNLQIIRRSLLYDWQKHAQTGPSYNTNSRLPEGAQSYLHTDNPRLKELQDRYLVFNEEVTKPLVWNPNYVRSEDILYFRGDNAYVWQLRGPNMNVLSYALTTFYVKSIDKLDLLNRLEEDEFFGNFVFTIDNKLISRDLLDSIIEIYFLEKHLSISSFINVNILDIGAGYGRLAHRLLSSFPNVQKYCCTDAVAASTFVSEYYLRFRKSEDRGKVLCLDEIEDALKNQPIDIAINIHSFSECRVSAIEWWLSLLAKKGVKYLMIVLNSLDHGGELLLTNEREDFKGVVEKNGYKLIVKEPKYRDPVVQKYGIGPTYYYLFELH